MLALLLGILALAPPAGTVDVDGARWRALVEGAPREVELPGPQVAERQVQIAREGDGLVIRGRWSIRALRPGWFMGDLLGPHADIRKATWNGKPAAIERVDDGIVVAGYVDRDIVLEVEAFIAGDPSEAPLTLELLPAIRGRVELPPAFAEGSIIRATVPTPVPPQTTEEAENHDDAPALPPEIADLPPPRRGDVLLTGAGQLRLSEAPRQPADAGTLVTATSGVGLTIGDAELRGRAQIRFNVLRGALDRVSLDARGLGDDLEVTGAGIRDWRRSGDRIEVELQAPVRGRLDLTLRWSAAVAKAAESSQQLPQIAPQGVFRSSYALQLARDGEIEVLPELDGWTAVAGAELPEWGRGLVEGTPTAAYTAADTRSGRLGLLRFVPVEGPPVVVDVAGITVATSREGRLLMRAHYEVRNERAAHLKITPPPGMRILGARVAGETALPARGSDGAWLIPLKRSIETVKGALSFAVEVTLLSDASATDDRWGRRERRELALPRVSAPVAVTRLTLHLPPGYTSLRDPGEGDVVAEFTRGEGITYGMGFGDVGAAEADARFQAAVSSWMSNDFEAAQAELDALKEMGAQNENIERLQANLDVIQGGSSGGDAAAERRIKEQAKARAVDDYQRQEKTKQKAEEYRASGEYDKAEAEYEKALEIGERLALLEQEESVEQKRTNEALALEYKSVQDVKKRRSSSFGGKRSKKKEAKAGRFASFGPGSTDDATVADGSELQGPEGEGGGGGGENYGSLGAEPPGVGGSGTILYEFEDDNVDGLLLTPDGTQTTPGSAEPSSGKVVSLDESANIPIGGQSRDFTQIVEVTPTASRDSAGIRLAGTTGAESSYVVDGANVNDPRNRRIVAKDRGPTQTLFDEPAPDVDAMRRADLHDAAKVLDAPPEPEPEPVVMDMERAMPMASESRRRISSRQRVSFGGLRGRRAARKSDSGGGGGGGGGRMSTKAAPDKRPPTPAEAPAPPMDTNGDTDGDGLVDAVDELLLLEDEEATEGRDDDGGLGRLAAPQVTASAMSLVIPAAGEPVLYQHLLLAADADYSVEIAAREPLRPRKRPRKRQKGRRR
ncbi:MAG: hypothetical protein KC486_26970 [Myxococcales bacterium]|nr:hypothetical protein [Myxococcales bacterium]